LGERELSTVEEIDAAVRSLPDAEFKLAQLCPTFSGTRGIAEVVAIGPLNQIISEADIVFGHTAPFDELSIVRKC
jgi:hypothetical protein